MPEKHIYRIFISSCKRLLEEERRILSDCILNSGNLPLMMEVNFDGSNSTYSLEIDKSKIDQSDCVIFILSYLYGEKIHDKIDKCEKCPLFSKKDSIANCMKCCMNDQNICSLSFTEFEYEYAKQLKKPMIVIFNKKYNSSKSFEEKNELYIKANTENESCVDAFYSKRDNNVRFVSNTAKRHAYPYTNREEFIGCCLSSIQCAQEIISELEVKENKSCGLIPYAYYSGLKQTETEIRDKLLFLQKYSVEMVFDSQKSALDALSIAPDIYFGSDGSISPIRVLAIRGISFIETGRDWREFILDDKYKNCNKVPVEFVLSSEKNTQLIIDRSNAFKEYDENTDTFIENYKNDIDKVHIAIKRYKQKHQCDLYLYNNIKPPFRMVFIGMYLYLSFFLRDKQAMKSPVFKIRDSSSLYRVCEDYYNSVKESSTLF
jgi:hypothetical protein